MAHISYEDYTLLHSDHELIHRTKHAFGNVRRAARCTACCCGTYLGLNVLGVVFQIAFITLKMILYFQEVSRCKQTDYQSRICINASKLQFLGVLYFLLAILGHGFGIYFSVLGIQASRKKTQRGVKDFVHFFALQFSLSAFTLLGCLFIIHLELGVHAPQEIKDQTGTWIALGVGFLVLLSAICSCVYFGAKEFLTRVQAYESMIPGDNTELIINTNHLTNVDFESHLINPVQMRDNL